MSVVINYYNLLLKSDMVKVCMQWTIPFPDFASTLKINSSNGRDLFPLGATEFCPSSHSQDYTTFSLKVSLPTLGHTNVSARQRKNKKKVKLKIMVCNFIESNVSTHSQWKVNNKELGEAVLERASSSPAHCVIPYYQQTI